MSAGENKILHQDLSYKTWPGLVDAVRSGKPAQAVEAEERGREFFPKLVAGLFPLSFGSANTALAALPGKARNQIKTVLDVAAGSGAWSIPFAMNIPYSRVTVVDFPEVTPITRDFTAKFGVASSYDYIEGNIRKLDFRRNRYV